MRHLTVCVSSFMVCAVVGVVLVGGLIGCGGIVDSQSVYGGQGGSAVDAQTDSFSGGQGGSAGKGGYAGTGGSGGTGASGGTGGGGVVEGPSCNGLAKKCGDKGNKSCCSSLLVPGGKFMMGRSENGTDACPRDMSCREHEQPEHEVTVSDCYLDEFEVTVGRFRKFVEAYEKPKEGAGAHPKIPGSGWKKVWNEERRLPNTADELIAQLKCSEDCQTWRDTVGDMEQHPINCVTWYDAFAFCAWDGGRLPTEAEWEKAAAGGDQNRLYPWGSDTPNGSFAVYFSSSNNGNGDEKCDITDIAKVGMLPLGQGRWSHKDLAGNMWEWVLDGWDEKWYSKGGNVCTDCANIKSDSHRVQRSGSHGHSADRLRAADRDFRLPVIRFDTTGFRCARDH